MMMRPFIYALLNAAFHALHLAIILFVMFAWIFPVLRPAHLLLVLLTLSSWFILGRWMGSGYCPISDWHWKIKAALGGGKPDGTYIHQLLQNISGRKFNSANVDKFVVMTTMVIAVISLALNVCRFWC